MKKGLLILFIVLVFAVNCFADDYTAVSCSLDDVRYATSQVEASGGGTVHIPAGDCTWNATSDEGIAINSSVEVSFEGAGNGADPASNTILRNTTGGNFFWYTIYGVHPYWTISNIRFYSSYGCTSGCNNSDVVQIRNSESFRFHHNHIEGYFHNTIHPKSQIKGLIDNNVFINYNVAVLKSRYNVGMGSPYDGGPPNPLSHVPPDGIPWCDSIEPIGDPPTVYGCTCEVGTPAYDRGSYVATGKTAISSGVAQINGAATSGTGVVQRIYVNIATVGSNPLINVASFSRSGDVFTARARTTGLSVAVGSNQFAVDDGDFTAFAINNGDYIGVYLSDCTLEASTSGGNSSWTIDGDQTAQSGVDFGAVDTPGISLWGDIYDDDDITEDCEQAWTDYYNDTTRGGGLYQVWDNDWHYDENAIYIEDNDITWYSNHTFMNWGGSGRMVIRHNTMTSFRSGVMSWAKPGNNFSIWHDNEFIQTAESPTGYVHWISVNALVYNNLYYRFSGNVMTTEAYRHYTDYYFPYMTRPKEIFIWGNTFSDCNCSDINDCYESASEGRYWYALEGENGVVHLRAPTTGDRIYSGDPENPIDEYPYPHPLRADDPPTSSSTTTVSGSTTTISGTTTTTTTPSSTTTTVSPISSSTTTIDSEVWYTPESVHSSCYMSDAGAYIDGFTNTVFDHWTTHEHWLVMDMGSEKTVTKIRHYHQQWTTTNAIAAIYISTDAATWGTTLGSLAAYSSAASGWKELDITDKTGRYIKVETASVSNPYLREFEYTVGEEAPVTTTTTATETTTTVGATTTTTTVGDADCDYYLDTTSGSDSNAGTSSDAAWKTVKQLNATTLSAGETVCFKKGETFLGQIQISDSGTSDNYIVYQSYGSGAKPIITGVTNVTSWDTAANWTWTTIDEGSFWRLGSDSQYNDIHRLYIDGTEVKPAQNLDDIDSTNVWYYDDNEILYLYGTQYVTPTSLYSTMQHNNGVENSVIYPDENKGIDYIHIKDLDIRGGATAIYLFDCDHWIIEGCNIGNQSGEYGIRLYQSEQGSNDYNIIRNCTIDSGRRFYLDWYNESPSEAFAIRRGSYNKFYNNTIKDWLHAGISFSAFDPNYVVAYNEAYDNYITAPDIDYGRAFGMGGNRLKTHHNKMYRNYAYDTGARSQIGGYYNEFYYNVIDTVTNARTSHDIGYAQGLNISTYGSTVNICNRFQNNTILNCDEAGIWVNSYLTSTDHYHNTIANNLVYDCGNNPYLYHVNQELVIDTNNVGTNYYQNNLFYNPDESDNIKYSGSYIAIAAFNALSVYMADNLGTDPLLKDASNQLYTLKTGSPAIDTGNMNGWVRNYLLDYTGRRAFRGSAVDIGAFEYNPSKQLYPFLK